MSARHGQLVADLQPLGVLAEHAVHDADEGLVAVEEAVPPREQIALQQALADMLAEHGVHHAPVRGQVVVEVHGPGVPGPVRGLKDAVQAVGVRLVRAEGAEIALGGVELIDVAHEFAQLGHVLRLHRAGEGHVYRIIAEIRHPQVAEELAAVGVGVGAHAPLAARREVQQVRHRHAVGVEELLRAVAAQPLLDLPDVLGGVRLYGHLVRAPVAFHLQPVHIVRARPALGRAQHDHRPPGPQHVAVFPRVRLTGEYLLHALVKRVRHRAVHGHRLAALHEMRLPAAAGEEGFKLLVRDAGKDGGVGYLIAVQVQYGQHGAVRFGVDELVQVPARGKRACLGLAVANHGGRDQPRVVRHGAEGVREGVAQLAALVDGARGLRRHMAGYAAGEGELLEEPLHALPVAGDVRIDFLIAAVQPVLSDHGVAAVARAGDVYHVQAVLLDGPVEVGVDEILAGDGAPMSDDLLFDIAGAERFFQQGVVQQIELAGGEVVGCSPIAVDDRKFLFGGRGLGKVRHDGPPLIVVPLRGRL